MKENKKSCFGHEESNGIYSLEGVKSMKIIQEVAGVIEELKDVVCDSCGKSCKAKPEDPQWGFEYMTLKANWGYFSGKDLETWEAHVCEKCVDEKLGFINFLKKDSLRK